MHHSIMGVYIVYVETAYLKTVSRFVKPVSSIFFSKSIIEDGFN